MLLWEIWRKNRLEISLSLVAIPFFAALLRWLITEPPSDQAVIGAVYPLGMAILLTVSVFSYVQVDVRKTTSGFPAHTFRLPVRTEILVAVPMLFGLIVAPVTYLVWSMLVYRPVGIELALWWPALIIAAGMVLFQTVAWTLGGYPILRLIAFVAVASGLFWLGIAASGAFETNFPIRRAMSIGLPILIVCAYRLAVFGVSRYRCGEWPRNPRADSVEESSRPVAEEWKAFPRFSSPQRAQFWLEWRQFGFLIPAYIGVVLFVLFVMVLASDLEVSVFWQFFTTAIFLPIGMGALAGPTFAHSGLWARNADLSQFGATRPVTDTSLANAKLKALAASLLAGWLMIAFLGPVWVYLSGHGQLVLNLWHAFVQVLEPAAVAPTLILAVLALVAVSWVFAASGLCLSLTGRQLFFYVIWVISAFLTIGLMITVIWLYRHPESVSAVLRWARRLEWVVLTLGIAVSLAAYIEAGRRRFLTGRTMTGVPVIAASLVGATGLLAHKVAPPYWHHLAGTGALLVALSMAPIAAGPLALYLNRHR